MICCSRFHNALQFSGLLTEKEKTLLLQLCGKEKEEDVGTASKFIEPNLFCVPLAWSSTIVSKARQADYVKDDMALQVLVTVRFFCKIIVYVIQFYSVTD